MAITTSGTTLTFNDATTQTTAPVNTNANVNSVAAGTGISVSATTGALTVTNAGVTSVTAGTGISVSGSTGGVTITNSQPFSGSTSQLAKAWVNFTGTTINASYNVSSVTTAGTGDFTVNLTNALTDTNYAIVGTAISNLAAINPAILTPKVGGTLTTSAFQIQCAQYNGSLVANTGVGVSVFR